MFSRRQLSSLLLRCYYQTIFLYSFFFLIIWWSLYCRHCLSSVVLSFRFSFSVSFLKTPNVLCSNASVSKDKKKSMVIRNIYLSVCLCIMMTIENGFLFHWSSLASSCRVKICCLLRRYFCMLLQISLYFFFSLSSVMDNKHSGYRKFHLAMRFTNPSVCACVCLLVFSLLLLDICLLY